PQMTMVLRTTLANENLCPMGSGLVDWLVGGSKGLTEVMGKRSRVLATVEFQLSYPRGYVGSVPGDSI
ncbi:MAG: hypothetical protein AAF958_20100, partial [Planctomycetota bacterium]